MGIPFEPQGPTLNKDAMGVLMPLSMWVGRTGRIEAAGPTLAKVAGRDLTGEPFDRVFQIEHDEAGAGRILSPDLQGRRLNLRLAGPNDLSFRGVVAPAGPGQGVVVNLSFGIRASEAVRRNGLTVADFAPTDLTVELLYLTEVKAAVMGELAALNRRLREARDSAEHKAITDPLTGLANRRGFEAALARSVAAARRGRPFALLHIDLDRFKAVNDTHGHAAGDAVLVAVAAALRHVTRSEDIAGRLGGDEFAVILPGMTVAEQVLDISRRLILAIERPVPHEEISLSVGASIGAVLSSAIAEPVADLILSAADEATYDAKRAGRGRAVIYRAA